MPNTRHDQLTGLEIHTPITWIYSNAAARNAATGFVAADLYKFALQSDTGSVYFLSATTPVWVAVGGSAGFTNPMSNIGDIITGGAAGAAQRLGIGTIGQALNTVNGAPYLTAPAAPAPTTAGTGGTIAAGTYTVATTYVNAQGETVASTSGTVVTTGTTSTITVPSPPAAGANSQAATGWYAYVSQAGLAVLTRQQAAGSPTAIGTALTLTAPPTSTGAGVPAGNTAGSLVPAWAAAAGGGGSAVIRLDFVETTDLFNSTTITAATWTDLKANQSFTKSTAGSVIAISFAVGMLLGELTNAECSSRMVVDSAGTAVIRKLGGTYVGSAAYTNPFIGASTVYLSGLAAGSHTVKLQIYAAGNKNAYLMASTSPNTHSLSIQVVELG